MVRFGKKHTFAVEYLVSNKKGRLEGHYCLWVGGHRVGHFDESVLLLSTHYGLVKFKDRLDDLVESDFDRKDPKDIFTIMYFDDFDNGKFLLNLGEGFDDYNFFGIKSGTHVNFVWRLIGRRHHGNPVHDSSIHWFAIPISEFVSVVDEVSFKLQSLSQ